MVAGVDCLGLRCGAEQARYLLVSLLIGFLSEIQVFATGLTFSRKSVLQIATRFAHNTPPDSLTKHILIEITG
jgi:hypothetical protein